MFPCAGGSDNDDARQKRMRAPNRSGNEQRELWLSISQRDLGLFHDYRVTYRRAVQASRADAAR